MLLPGPLLFSTYHRTPPDAVESFRSKFGRKTHGCCNNNRQDLGDELFNQFILARDYLLNDELEIGEIEEADFAAADFEIIPELFMVSYTLAGTNIKKSWAVEDIAHEKTRKAVEDFIKAANKRFLRHIPVGFKPRSTEGNIKSAKVPFQRESEGLKLFPDTFVKTAPSVARGLLKLSTPEERAKALKQDAAAEFFRQRIKTRIEESLEKKREELAALAPNERRARGRIGLYIERLEALAKTLSSVDPYALSVASLNYVKNPEDPKAIETAFKQVEEEFEAMVESIGGRKSRSTAATRYINDLKQALLLKRLDKYESFKQSMRREALEDLFLREAIRFVENPDHYTADKLQESHFFQEGFEDVKSEIDQILTEVARDVKLVVTEPEVFALQSPAEQKALEKSIEEYRASIVWNMLTPPPPPSALARFKKVVPRIAGAGALGVLGAATTGILGFAAEEAGLLKRGTVVAVATGALGALYTAGTYAGTIASIASDMTLSTATAVSNTVGALTTVGTSIAEVSYNSLPSTEMVSIVGREIVPYLGTGAAGLAGTTALLLVTGVVKGDQLIKSVALGANAIAWPINKARGAVTKAARKIKDAATWTRVGVATAATLGTALLYNTSPEEGWYAVLGRVGTTFGQVLLSRINAFVPAIPIH